MAKAGDVAFAKQLVRERLAGTGKNGRWPNVPEQDLAAGLIARVDDPSLVYQSTSNLCGMGSFVRTLATEEPVQYVWLAIYLYKEGRGRLGRKDKSIVIAPGTGTRSSPMPPTMNAADWVLMASLRDHLNGLVRYGYDTRVPILGDIPVIGPLFGSWIAEPIAGITWPSDLVNLLQAIGAVKVVNAADTVRQPGLLTMERASQYFAAGYTVFLLISTGMFSGGKGTPTAEHWVTLISQIEDNIFAFRNASGQAMPGVSFTVYDTAIGQRRKVPPPPAQYIPQTQFTTHFYGFVAARWS